MEIDLKGILGRSKTGIILLTVVLASVGAALLWQENARHSRELHMQVADDLQDVVRDMQSKFFALEMTSNRLATAAASEAGVSRAIMENAAGVLISLNPSIAGVSILENATGSSVDMGLHSEAVADYAEVALQFTVMEQPFISEQLPLDDGGMANLLAYPVYLKATNDRSGVLWGTILVAFRSDEVLAVPPAQKDFPGELSLAMRGVGANSRAQSVFGDEKISDLAPVSELVAIGTGRWELLAAPRAGWPKVSPFFMPMLLVICLVIGAIAGVLTWIRKLSREKARAHKMLKNAIEAIDAGFVLYDENDRLMICNSRFAAPFKEYIGEIHPGMRYETLLRLAEKGRRGASDASDRAWLKERLAAHKSGQEFVYRRPDQSWVKVSETRTADGFSVSVLSDITAFKQAQTSAEQANRQKTDFLSNVTHELRTPLTVIIGYSQFLANKGFLPQRTAFLKDLGRLDDMAGIGKSGRVYDEAVSDYAGKIARSADHMLTLVNDLLDWAEVERGKVEMNPTDVAIDDIVTSVIGDLQSIADKKGIELKGKMMAETTFADHKRLRQVLYNLVGNALKFTETGSITIDVQKRDDFVRFSVQDTGCGIPAEDIERIFERFQQVDNSSTRSHGGFGLGLAIAKQIVEAHGGRMSATSVVGEGSRFYFDMPAADPQGEPADVSSAA